MNNFQRAFMKDINDQHFLNSSNLWAHERGPTAWGCSSGAEHLLSMHEVLSAIPSCKRQKPKASNQKTTKLKENNQLCANRTII